MSPRYLSLTAVTAASSLAAACTSLGPVPATTGISAVPHGRNGVDLQAGVVPAFRLSDAARTSPPDGSGPTSNLSGLVELGHEGFVVGARKFGDDGDHAIEPMIGLRRKLDDHFSVAGVAFGTRISGAQQGASYTATHLGGELAADALAIPFASWMALHVQAGVSATYLDASGTYCVDSTGDATDCDDHSTHVDATVRGVYAAATGGVSLDIARRPHGTLHDIRLAMMYSIGAMPHLSNGEQQPSSQGYKSVGLTLTIGFGDD